MNILSLFDGLSGGQLALQKAGIKYDNYFASEIDKNAMKIATDNFPNTIHIGDVTKVSYCDGVLHTENGEFEVGGIDLLIGGSPCQGFSFSGKQLNFDDERSKLYFEYKRILEEVKPKFFMLENVKMKTECEEVITHDLKVESVLIDSAKFSAQSRERLYWTNIPFEKEIEDKGIVIRDILDRYDDSNIPFDMLPLFVPPNDLKHIRHTKNYMQYDVSGKGHNSQSFRARYLDKKCCTLTASCSNAVKIHFTDKVVRRATVSELERLQTIPVGYTKSVTRAQASKAIGNGWTIDVIAHIFKGLK